MTARSAIYLGDLAHSLTALAPSDAATTEAIARVLGFHIAAQRESGPTAAPSASAPAPVPRDATTTTFPEFDGLPVDERSQILPSTLSMSAAETNRSEPSWLSNHPPLSPTGAGEAPASFEALLHPEWTNGALVSAGMKRVDGRQIDVPALVREICAAKLLLDVPFRRRWSRRDGVQLLLDASPGMYPYQQDSEWLRTTMPSLFSDSQLAVLRFTRTPSHGAGPGPRHTWKPWSPPLGASVLLFSDLGVGKPAFNLSQTGTTDEWIEFADALIRRRIRPLCLTPYRSSRFPQVLRQRFVILPLNRETSARTIRAALSRSLSG